MLKIGLTGGIGSGKSTVAQIFEVLGIPVYYADTAAKNLMQDERVSSAIKNSFGEDVYKGGMLDRKYLADIVFKDEAKLTLLNSIVHPVTIQDANDWIKRQTAPYIIKEAALIFESGSYKYLDHVIGISSPTELSIERAMKRDNIKRNDVLSRMNKQMDETEKLKRCDFIIFNDEQQLLIPQVLQLHQKLLALNNPALKHLTT